MNAIVTRLHRELSHFTSLPYQTRLLIISFTLRNVAYPLIGMFTSAFIWRVSDDLTLLIMYNIGNFAVVPLMFIVNAWLLRRFRLSVLYGIGTVLTGVSALMVVFFRVTSPTAYLLYGMLYGIGNGIYWANRNFLTLRHTASSVRSYVTGLLFTLSTLTSIIVPAIAGWYIVITKSGYEVLVVTAFVTLLIAGRIVEHSSFDKPNLTINRQPFSTQWKRMRILAMAIGAVDVPLYILPTVLILITLGNEGILGTVSSFIAVATAVITYAFGRKQNSKHFMPVFIGLIIAFALAGIPLLSNIGALTVLIYVFSTNLADNLIWTAFLPKLMDVQDDEVKRNGKTHYHMLLDFEWFINIGRVAVMLIFLGIALLDSFFALRIITIVSGVLALGLTGLTLRIRTHRSLRQQGS